MELEKLVKEASELKKELAKQIEEIKSLNERKDELEVVGKFSKVSFDQFKADYGNIDEQELKYIYNDVLVNPVRSSIDSAGNDFVLTKDLDLEVGDSIEIVTGIRAEIIKGWLLMITPRSGLGSKFRVQIDNTLGIIDGDYFGADNEGHIKIKLTNDGKEGKSLHLKKGDRFVQGIFIPYGIASGDKPLGKRIGGFNSSGV